MHVPNKDWTGYDAAERVAQTGSIVAGAVAFVRSLLTVQSIQTGYDVERLLLIHLRYDDGSFLRARTAELLGQALPRLQLGAFYWLRFTRIYPCLLLLLAALTVFHLMGLSGYVIDPQRATLTRDRGGAHVPLQLARRYARVPARSMGCAVDPFGRGDVLCLLPADVPAAAT